MAKGMKVIIAGSRHFNDYRTLKETCDYVLKDKGVKEIVSGGCKGADKLGEKYASMEGIYLSVFDANWKRFGNAAGPIRNAEMVNYADGCIVFSSGGKGSKDVIKKALKKGLWVYIHEIKNPR